MAWKKAPDALKALMEKAMQGIDAEKRTMFGFPCWFVNANMFAGLFEDSVFVRLSPAQTEKARAAGRPFPPLAPMPGRPMKAYSVIPKEVHTAASQFRALLEEAARHAASLPPKQPKTPKKAPKRPTG
jgi:TfoX/Sxy family transcriptional regulator of competence genes